MKLRELVINEWFRVIRVIPLITRDGDTVFYHHLLRIHYLY